MYVLDENQARYLEDKTSPTDTELFTPELPSSAAPATMDQIQDRGAQRAREANLGGYTGLLQRRRVQATVKSRWDRALGLGYRGEAATKSNLRDASGEKEGRSDD